MFTQLKISKNAMRHIAKERPELSEEMIQDAFHDDYAVVKKAPLDRKVVYGDAGDGKLLTIVGEPRGTVLHLKTCRPMNDKEKAEYRTKRKKRMGY